MDPINDATQSTNLQRYRATAEHAASIVIRDYSTSFGWASKLLPATTRIHIANIYAMVRVADEVVDGSAVEALGNGSKAQAEKFLNAYEDEIYRAIDLGFSTDLVVQAFSDSARQLGIGRDLIEPFFDSMRMDLAPVVYDQNSYEKYIYGSAEVVGLMCVKAFLATGEESWPYEQLVKPARALGSAFQKVNFLRDLAADFQTLGRCYFPRIDPKNFSEEDKSALVAEIDGEIQTAIAGLSGLPKSARKAVSAALLFFDALNREIENTSATKLVSTRVRVSDFKKAFILIKALSGVTPK